MPPPSMPTAAVVIATYNRPDFVRTCLEHLAKQTLAPVEIAVVDASPDSRTREIVRGFPDVLYLRNERGAGSTATSRAIGMSHTGGEVVAFIDDDAFAAPDWLEQLLRRYAEPAVAAVGGRALNGQPGEEHEGIDQIGLLLPDGRLTGHFAADPGHDVDVDHMLGANMSVRRSVVEALGGIHDYYPGTCLREETDIALRIRRVGLRIVYTPDAVVEHVAGPYARGRRFDLRYTYYGQRNHLVLLSRTLGVRDRRFHRYVAGSAREIVRDLTGTTRSLVNPEGLAPRARVRRAGGSLARGAAKLAGLGAGFFQVVRLRVTEGALQVPDVASMKA